MVAGGALCQLGLYLTLPYFSLLRALMGYSWFCDQKTHQSHPMALIAYSCLCFGVLILHAACYHPEPAQSGEVDPLTTIDWNEVTARNARFRAREVAGSMLNTMLASSGHIVHSLFQQCEQPVTKVTVVKWPYVCTATCALNSC